VEWGGKMIIKYRNTGSIAEPDKFMGMESCCHELSMVILKNSQIQVTDKAGVYLLPSCKFINYCPFCGKKVEKVNVCSSEEIQKTKDEIKKWLLEGKEE